MKTKTRNILKKRARTLQGRLKRKGKLSEIDTAKLRSFERHLGRDQQREIERAAFEHAISKEA